MGFYSDESTQYVTWGIYDAIQERRQGCSQDLLKGGAEYRRVVRAKRVKTFRLTMPTNYVT